MDFLSFIPIVGSLVSGLFGGNKTESSSQKQESTTSSSGRTLNEPTENALTSVILSLLGGGAQTAQNNLQATIQEDSSNPIDFDRKAFVKGVTDQAKSTTSDALESDLNGLFSSIGSGPSGNSMATLLANRERNKSAANLAGIEANAEATGAQIEQGIRTSKVSNAAVGANSVTDFMQAILQGLKGASIEESSQTKGTATATGNSSEFGFKNLNKFSDLITGIATARY